MSDKPVYLKAEQVAAKLGWHVKTVYRNRVLPRVKIGSSVVWIESQVDSFLAMHSGVKAEPKKREKRQRFTLKEAK